MSGNPGLLASICYEAESTFGETTTTATTYRVQTATPVETSGLTHDKVPSEVVVQRRNEGTQHIKVCMGGSFKIKLWLTGHGSTMVGSPSVSARETLMGLALGTAPALSATSSTTLTGGTAAIPTTTASGTFSAGSLCRVGSLNDGRGNGQFYAVGTHVTTNLTMIGALAGAPNNGDVLYPVVQLFGPESPTSANNAVTGIRCLLQNGNIQYLCHGCYPTSWTVTGLSPGEVPAVEITYGVSWWEYSSATFPSAVSTDTFLPAPIAAGSWNFNTVGTTTRSTRSFTNFSLTHTLGVVPIEGPGGVNAFQKYVGARRLPDTIEASWVEAADATTTSPVLPGFGTGTSFFHGEYTGSTTDGSAFGFKCPSMCVTNVPTQMVDNGINRFRINARAYTGATTTSELTLAAIVYGMA